jgi:hypothetical protein
VPESELCTEGDQHALRDAVIDAVGVGAGGLDEKVRLEPQTELRGDVQNAAAAQRQPRRAGEYGIAHRAGLARSRLEALGDEERIP